MGQREALVRAAESQKGVKSGREYVAWYNSATGAKLPLNCAWCAIFVSWCARKAGLTVKQVPNFAGCTTGRRLFQKLGIWRERCGGYEPARGDLVLFDWDGDPTLAEHVGIVTGADRRYVHTIEGNSGGQVRERTYPRTSSRVLGYAAWKQEEGEEDMTKAETQALIDRALERFGAQVQERIDQAAAAWEAKKQGEKRVYHRVEDVPDWARESVRGLVDAGELRGDGSGDLALTEEMLRVLVILARKGAAA